MIYFYDNRSAITADREQKKRNRDFLIDYIYTRFLVLDDYTFRKFILKNIEKTGKNLFSKINRLADETETGLNIESFIEDMIDIFSEEKQLNGKEEKKYDDCFRKKFMEKYSFFPPEKFVEKFIYGFNEINEIGTKKNNKERKR